MNQQTQPALEGPSDDAGTSSDAVGAERLRSFIERVERLEEEKEEIADQVKEVFAEIKGEGYDTAAVRAILKRRKQDPDKLSEQEAVMDLYMSALGMA